jgi:hypothetical protein
MLGGRRKEGYMYMYYVLADRELTSSHGIEHEARLTG